MVAHVRSFAFNGVEVIDIDVQVQFSNGLPAFNIVGLPAKAVSESRERVRSALYAMGLSLPPSRITINLSPADIPKEGSHFDLAIAIGILHNMGSIPQDVLDEYIIMGELALDGRLTKVGGVLPSAVGALERNLGVICPYDNGREALWAGEDINLLAPKNLLSIVHHFAGTEQIEPVTIDKISTKQQDYKYPDMNDIKGQHMPKIALEVAAAGGHNLLMSGPPGSGKSMLASRLGGILPELTPREMLEISMINSISGNLDSSGITSMRPMRSPHHNCSMPALIGGGSKARPGEISLAHNGVLFLDELPEFSSQVLDSLRQPLEEKKVSIARAQNHVTYPANFQLIAAMNPCKCGYIGDANRECNKAPMCGDNYRGRISGPLLDRIDIVVSVPAMGPFDVESQVPADSSDVIRQRVKQARDKQYKRYGRDILNANIPQDDIEKHVKIDDETRDLLKQAVDKFHLSMRGYTRSLRVARTIADLHDSDDIKKQHIAAALNFRIRKAAI